VTSRIASAEISGLFSAALSPNQPGSEWQFETNVVLSHESLGMVVLDVLKGDRLGGIEFVDKIKY
jgi:hypothetical protein